MTDEWADLMVSAVDEMESVLSMLLRWPSRTRGITGLANQFRVYIFSPYVCKRKCMSRMRIVLNTDNDNL